MQIESIVVITADMVSFLFLKIQVALLQVKLYKHSGQNNYISMWGKYVTEFVMNHYTNNF